jgi:hypothetical protein
MGSFVVVLAALLVVAMTDRLPRDGIAPTKPKKTCNSQRIVGIAQDHVNDRLWS